MIEIAPNFLCSFSLTLSNYSQKIIENTLVIPIMSKIKQTRIGKHMAPLKFRCYNQDLKLCVVTHMETYLRKTKLSRKSQSLFISYAKPHSAVGKKTISRWCRNLLMESGIDMCKYSSHSSRSAASSKAKQRGATLQQITTSAG